MKRINRILITAMVLVTVAMFANADIPPAPVGLDNDTGDYWVNYTWSKELGDPVDDNVNVTDSFNVSMNGTWYNGTATFLNKSVGPGGWANITVWAYNATGNGNMSVDNVSDNVQAPGAATELPRKCGYIPPLMDLSHLGGIPVKGIQAPGGLPDSFDWRDSGNVTPVKDQDPCGTCWAFGTTSVLESAVLINEGAEYNFSEQSIALCVDRSWTYLYNDTDDPCNAGGNSFIASEVFIKKGSVLESCNPYNTTALNCSGSCLCDDCAPVKRVDGYRLVTNDGSEIDVIKNAVYDHGPVTMSFYYIITYEYDDPTWGIIYDYYPGPESPNHLVSIIGWNDSVPHPDTDHDGTGAWIVKNSWGTGWGNDGFFYLAYNSSCVTEIAYLEYKDPVPDEELLYWDEAGFVGSVGYGDSGAWMASNFTADQSGNLTHVDFWTTSNNAEYEIYVWDGYFGIELANQTGTCQELGYYSIPLNTPIPMAAGQQFTVGVNMTTPGYNYPIPVEYEYGGDVNPPIQSNVSFIRHDASDSWTDMADPEWDKNACLRARMVATFNCACGDICVNTSGWWRGGSVFNANNTAPIQAAVDGATAGETICVAAGSYEENVNIGTSHLTLAGEGADVVNVTAPAPDPDGDHVFSVTADYVNISGFNVTGATDTGKAGIYLDSADHCNISDNNVSDNGWDIYIMSSDSTFTDNTLNGTTVSFTYSGDVSLKGVGSPAADPSGQNTIDKFINATNQSAGAWLYLNFSYSDSDVSGLDESSLAVRKHNGTDWLADGWNGARYLDATNNLVGANITTFSVFAPMASAAAAGAPNITSYAPDTPVSSDEGVAKTFNVTANQTVNATWYINGSEAQQNTTASTEVAYTNTSAVAGYWNVSVVVNNTNGTDMQTWWWTVNATQPGAPNIISYAPDTPVSNDEGATRAFNVTANQTVNATWYINESAVWQNTTASTEVAYTNTSAVAGYWNVSVVVNNTNGTDMQTWWWTVNAVHPEPNITSWDNNKTNNNSTTLTINELESVRFNATANQTIETWHWYKNGADQLSNFDNYTTSWNVNGTNTISVNATNANGTSNTVAWTVTVTDITAPGPVTNLTNDTTTATTVDLSWNANTEADLAGYRVYQNGALIDSPPKSRTYYNVTGLSSSTAYEFNVSAYDDNGLEGANASRTVTTAVGPLHHISVTPDSKTLNISESWNFTATGRDQNNGKISGLVFAWACSDTCIGSLNNSTGTVVNFTAGRVGITYITASNGRVTSDPVQVTVNAGTSNTTFANKTTFRAKSGDANATGNFKNNVSGWISATARGNATNSSEVNQSHPRSGLGSGDKVMGGVIVNVSGNITEELAAGNGTIRIQICYNATTLDALGIDASTLAIWKYNSTTEKWMQQSSTTTSEGCAHVDVNHLCTFALVGSKAIGSSTSGSGTYPPGWFGTPTATVTATKAPAASATTTDASHSDKVAPAPTKKPAASTATTPAAEGTTAKKGAPGFTAIFAIAGLLAIAYVLMRRRG